MTTYAKKHGWELTVSPDPAGYVKTFGSERVVLTADLDFGGYFVVVDGIRHDGLLPSRLVHGSGAMQCLKWIDTDFATMED